MAESKRVLIVYPVDFSEKSNHGVFDKMIGQSQGFSEQGYSVTQAYLKGKDCILISPETTYKYSTSPNKKWSKFYSFFKGLTVLLDKQEYDIIYLRHLLFTPSLYSFLGSVNRSKIIYEFPTYPYASEWKSGLKKMLLTMDQKYRSKCENLINLIIHYGGYKGPCENIQITNGVNLPPKLEDKKQNKSYIQLIAVGKWASWHGLDRIISSLVHTDQFRLKVIGEGPELARLQQQSQSLGISDKVEFISPLNGEFLSTELWNADIGIGTLGLHRKGVVLDSSLKHRLYAAHGLPFILSSEDSDFNESIPFVNYVEQSDVIIDLDKTLVWYNGIYSNHSLRHDIFDFAQASLGWNSKISKIISHFDTLQN